MAFLTLFAGSAVATEAGYPDRSVRVVLPFAAGGVADITVWIIAEKLSDRRSRRAQLRRPGASWPVRATYSV